MQDFDEPLIADDRMLLDVVLRIRKRDDSLTIRKSCREGVCPKGLAPSRAIEQIRLRMVKEGL